MEGVKVSINRPYTVEHFAKARLLVISVVPIAQAEKATLKVTEKGTSLIQKAGKRFKVKVMGKGNLAKIGDDFGKVGKLVEHPGTKIDWSKLSTHGMNRMSQRSVTKEMAESWVKNGKALSQNNGSKYFFL